MSNLFDRLSRMSGSKDRNGGISSANSTPTSNPNTSLESDSTKLQQLSRLLAEAKEQLGALNAALLEDNSQVSAAKLDELRDLIDEIEQVTQSAVPSPRFRNELRQALEATHRQQTAQRILFPKQPAANVDRRRSTRRVIFWSLGLVLLFWLWRKSQRTASH